MKQWNGLLMKDWTRVKTTVLVTLVLSFLLLFFFPVLFHKTFLSSVNLFDVMLVFNAFISVIYMLFSSVILVILLEKDMKRPDIWLYSTASAWKLVGAKFFLACLIGLAIQLLPFIAISVSYLFMTATIPFKEFAAVGAFGVVMAFLSASTTACFNLLAWVIYRLLRNKVGRLAIPVVLILIISFYWLFGWFITTDLYTEYFQIGAIPHSYFDNEVIQIQFFEAKPNEPVFYAGDMLFSLFMTIAPYMLAIVLFDKKVRY